MGLQKTKIHTHHFHMHLFNYFFLLQPYISCIENSIKEVGAKNKSADSRTNGTANKHDGGKRSLHESRRW
jgi:hypothetical protein